jgi:endonuclease YncB( thermonuclease family)
LTSKHNKLTTVNKTLTNFPQKDINCDFICKNCNKQYKSRVGLWKHNKKCINDEELINESNYKEPNDSEELIKYLMKENTEFKQLLIDQNKQMIELAKNSSNYNITNTNSNNKSFNLNFFLNETCKDAMNIMDFVDSLKLQLSDLENVGKIGFIDGISNIIVKKLKQMDVTLRPVHCSDSKREVMYVKDEDKWEKENENKQKIRNAIKCIAHKNSKLLNDFRDKHPDCIKSDSRYSDQYNKLVIEAFGGKGDNDFEKEDKIIHNIAKEVTIDK